MARPPAPSSPAEASPATPHDALFKSTFSKVEHARAILKDRLPRSLVDKVRWSTLRRTPGSFVKADLRERHTDLLFTARMRDRDVCFYLLFEHQSRPERWMLLRLLEYMIHIWWSHLDKHPRSTKLPVVVPVVLHHSDVGWQFDTRFEALFDVPEGAAEDVLPFTPRFLCVLDDISHASDDELRSRAITALGKLALGCLRHSRDMRALLESFAGWAAACSEVHSSERGFRAWAVVLRYIFSVASDMDTDEVCALIARATSQEIAEDVVTLAQKLREEGRNEGLNQGRNQGLKEGRTVGRLERSREIVGKQLRLKFRKLPASAQARLLRATEAQLDLWAERLLTASSLAEVLDG